jgi:putative ABC transport system substrate-binding protein
MKRRDFITLLGGAAAAWPVAARAQQPTMPMIGVLSGTSPEALTQPLAAFRKALGAAGFVEGRNVAIEYRWAQNDYGRLPELAAELVRRRVAVIVAGGGAAASIAAKAATTTIPIVFDFGGDPTVYGLVASFNRPGGNATGVASLATELGAKRLGLLRELLPDAASFAILVNPNSPGAERAIKEVQGAAEAAKRRIEILTATSIREIDAAFAGVLQKRFAAVLVNPSPLFVTRRAQLATLSAHYSVPAMYYEREFIEVGGLMSYGTSTTDQFNQVGLYTARILKGEKPSDLPVVQSVKFELIINMQTARILGIEIPPTLLALADEVLE